MKQLAINRAMQTYGMIKSLTPADEHMLRTELTEFIHAQNEPDERLLTVAGIKFLRARGLSETKI